MRKGFSRRWFHRAPSRSSFCAGAFILRRREPRIPVIYGTKHVDRQKRIVVFTAGLYHSRSPATWADGATAARASHKRLVPGSNPGLPTMEKTPARLLLLSGAPPPDSVKGPGGRYGQGGRPRGEHKLNQKNTAVYIFNSKAKRAGERRAVILRRKRTDGRT